MVKYPNCGIVVSIASKKRHFFMENNEMIVGFDQEQRFLSAPSVIPSSNRGLIQVPRKWDQQRSGN